MISAIHVKPESWKRLDTLRTNQKVLKSTHDKKDFADSFQLPLGSCISRLARLLGPDTTTHIVEEKKEENHIHQ